MKVVVITFCLFKTYNHQKSKFRVSHRCVRKLEGICLLLSVPSTELQITE